MDYKLKRIFFPIVSVMALVALACTCSGLGGATPTDPPPPTATKSAPPTKPPVEVPTQSAIATKPPIGNNTGDGGGDIVLSSTPYTHPSGAFSITFPEGWEVTEYDNSTVAVSSDGVASITVYFENAGLQLSADELTNYANAIEFNYYASYENYEQSSIEPQADGSTGIFKTLDSNGVAYEVSSYYWQDDTTLFIQDWWVTTDLYDALSDSILESINTITWNGSAASNQSLYPLRYTFNCPGNLCNFVAPYGWTYGHDDGSFNFTINDKFTSPDGRNFIDSTVYDDGTEISKSVAGKFALSLLKEFYAQDIVVTGDEVQPDGSERLDWKSSSGGYGGESFFETRGTTFLMWSWVVNADYFDLYSSIWGEIIGSYTIP